MRRWPLPLPVLAVLLQACGGPSPPNVVILLMDTLRADRLGCYGHHRDTSPVVDSLAARGTRFERAYAPADYTQASTASLFTGLYPLAHGYVNADYALAPEHRTLAEILGEHGYDTGAFIANALAGRGYGMEQGFGAHVERNRAGAVELTDSLVAWLGRAQPPLFAYAHYLDVHDPVRAPPAARERFAGPGGFAYDLGDEALRETMHAQAWWSAAQDWWPTPGTRDSVAAYFAEYGLAYDGTIRHWDAQVARVVAALRARGLDGTTILLLTSDHGEQLLEHGFFGHASSAYVEGLRVPLIWVDPTDTPPAVAGPVSLVDVLPSLLARLGIDAGDVQGRNLWPFDAVAEGATGDDAGIYTEGTFYANRPFHTLIQSYSRDGWKLVLDRFRDVKELYHVAEDPHERHDRFAERPAVVAGLYDGLRRRYADSLARLDGLADAARPGGLDEARERQLRALGYVGGQRGRRGREFLALAPEPPTRYGPFGDEPGLASMSSTVDFSLGMDLRQVVGGYSGPGSHGAWFDRRATFLLRRDAAGAPVHVEIYADPSGPGVTRLQAWIDGRVIAEVAVPRAGPVSFDVPIPAAAGAGFYQLELRADRRFVLRPGASPRAHVHGAFQVVRIGPAHMESDMESDMQSDREMDMDSDTESDR